MARLDPHSFTDASQPRTRSLRFDLEVDFERRRLHGTVVLELNGPAAGPLDLDTRGLTIHEVATLGGRPVPFTWGEEDPVRGRLLRLELPASTGAVLVRYETAPDAVGLQWLEPAQTEGRSHPFLFSQCQPIHARTLAPLQDTPYVRVSYQAAITVPEPLTAVMSAGPAGERPGPRPGTRTYLFEMPQPIPTYLLALAVGNLRGIDLSPRSRVWAEPETVEKAAWEFAEIESMIRTAESMFGPYDWDRYDMLVLPPSFPYGGMENPRMTFLTPTLLAGDRSLVDVVAHELAHSWTGNLVTNATMDHFWLNEGFTVWAERRIVEALHGEPAAALGWAIGQKALDAELHRFRDQPQFTQLRQDLAGIDPDEVFSSIPYEKGSRFLALLERQVGRPSWDAFMREYMARFRFTSITTEQFVAFLEEKLPGALDAVNGKAWLHEPGLPGNAPRFPSEHLDAISGLAEAFRDGARPTPAQLAAWSPAELLLYVQHVPRPLDRASCEWLDEHLKLTGRGNHEILVEWLVLAASSDHAPVFERIREVLTRVGRMKYLRPLYGALGTHPRTRALGREIFAAASPGYHALSRKVVQSILDRYAE